MSSDMVINIRLILRLETILHLLSLAKSYANLVCYEMLFAKTPLRIRSMKKENTVAK